MKRFFALLGTALLLSMTGCSKDPSARLWNRRSFIPLMS